MTPEAQQFAIAIAVGLQEVQKATRKGKPDPGGVCLIYLESYVGGWKEYGFVPDYLNDLNAMHEAEGILEWKPDDEYCQAAQYYEQLIFICGRPLIKGKAFGYVCHICGEQIYDSQETDHSDSGLIHAKCPKADCYEWHLIRATASQRAEAFLRTIGKWVEE